MKIKGGLKTNKQKTSQNVKGLRTCLASSKYLINTSCYDWHWVKIEVTLYFPNTHDFVFILTQPCDIGIITSNVRKEIEAQKCQIAKTLEVR